MKKPGPPARFTDPEALADAIVRKVGRKIVLALPLGLGKANHVANALYQRAVADPWISLNIFTALTLEPPRAGSEIEKRFLGPINERLFGSYPGLLYAEALRDGTLPPNVEVNEFFMLAGRWLNVPQMQRHYIAANYTQALNYVLDRGANVVAQLVARKGMRYSIASNTDMTLDMLTAKKAGRADFLFVGQVNSELPFMEGEADLPSTAFTHILESEDTDFPLFAPPKEPVDFTDHAVGVHVARLVPDGGTLQIGIGSMADAVVHALILRHKNNIEFRKAVGNLSPHEGGHLGRFKVGLYGASEMLVDGFLELIRAGVLKRIGDGAVLHAGFFLGPKSFYKELRDMPKKERARIKMTAISYVNSLLVDEAKKRKARTDARFVNTAMMATLNGAVISDGLEDGRVVSGVGGQHDFVTQAFALDGARSIITLNATRHSKGETISNIVWNYGHTTVPRHLKDIIVTEYGVADLRGKTDRDTIAAMLNIADSRFQPELLAKAKASAKIEGDYEIPAAARSNTPERIEQALSAMKKSFPVFPFGTDFTAEEQILLPALAKLKAASGSRKDMLKLAWRGYSVELSREKEEALRRIGFDRPRGMKNIFYAALVRAALKDT
ncbi:acetyl-CoA hydrolase [Terrihabitans soli]|uniref:Acetyl-CoA hydrolase n=1 Tax=Terrihabitans soli TaxID=708113 RepID=A0A6S6QI46_9HYPH|nr:acetyl-CoA hydrolase/transferase C-terminal domain-containing protein [Terrihabitans soli]BCJ90903.1 acetyl-CoA hydrolase [Terrihabitans soli]